MLCERSEQVRPACATKRPGGDAGTDPVIATSLQERPQDARSTVTERTHDLLNLNTADNAAEVTEQLVVVQFGQPWEDRVALTRKPALPGVQTLSRAPAYLGMIGRES